MKTTHMIGLFGLALAVSLIGSAVAQEPHGGAKLFAEAKIKPDQARALALNVQPGKIKDWEIEKENGGSGLRYSFDIDAGGVTHEVGVDARDGKILENVVESAADEAREAKEDEK